MSNIVLYLKVLLHRVVEPVRTNKYVENRPAPAMMKRRVVAGYAQKYHCNVFIETGTYLGEMVEYQARNFEKVYSIEIAEALFKFSSKRLRKRKNVIIEKGDSGVVLGGLSEGFLQMTEYCFGWTGIIAAEKRDEGNPIVPFMKS